MGEAMARRRRAKVGERTERFPVVERYTVSGLCLGELCLVCESRVLEIGSLEAMTLAWCDCAFPEDHHEMELL